MWRRRTSSEARRSGGTTDPSARRLVWALTWLLTVAVANTTSAAVAQPAIRAEFGLGPASVAWIVFGYLAAFSIAAAWYGAIARRFGASVVLASGASMLVLGAVGAALSQSFLVLMAFRIMQAFGAGAIPTLAPSIAGERLDPVARARAIGAITAGVGLGQAIGLLIGGFLVQYFSWRAAVSFGVLALPAILVVLREHRSLPDPSVRLDLRGSLLLAVGVFSATWALNQAPLRGADVSVVAALLGLVLVLVVLRAHLARTPHAFLPLEVLRRPNYRSTVVLAAILLASFNWMVTGVPLVLGPTGLPAALIGSVLVPMAAGVWIAARWSAEVVARHGFRRTVRIGNAVIAVSALIAGAAAIGGSAVLLALAIMPFGVAYGMLASPYVNRVTGLFGQELRPPALGSYNVLFFIGGAMGGSIASALIDRAGDAPAVGFAQSTVVLAVACAAVVVLLGRAEAEPVTEDVGRPT